jgi:hypothetical protein
VAFFAWDLCHPPRLAAGDPAEKLENFNLNVGCLRSCFLNVNQPDAEGAFEVLAKTVGRQRGYHIMTQTGAVNLAIVDSGNLRPPLVATGSQPQNQKETSHEN